MLDSEFSEKDEFLSSSDDDVEDSTAHAKLLADLQGITKKNKRTSRNSTTRIRVARSGGSGVDLGVLAELGKELPKVGFAEAAPNSRAEQKRISRKRGYEDVAEDINKWEGIVQQQRSAPQLSFPLQDNSMSIFKKDAKFKPLMKTDLEKQMYALLNAAELIKPKEESAEQRAVREAMTLEEVLERNKESWRKRKLQEKLGQKAHLKKKTKSKKYHRILKKDRLKQDAANIEKLQKSDPEKAADKLQELENIRIEERMTLKHKKSKWAANLQLRAKTDKTALAALQENSRLHKEMVHKLQKKGEEEDKSDEGRSESNDEDDADNGSDSDQNDTKTDTNNCAPAEAVQSQSFKKMKAFWGEYNKQKETENKEQIENIRKRRKLPKKDKEEQAIEEANRIIQEKLRSAKQVKTKKAKKKSVSNNDEDNSKNNKDSENEADDNEDESDDNEDESDDNEDESNNDDSNSEEECEQDGDGKIREPEFTFSSIDKPDSGLVEGAKQFRTLEEMETLRPGKKNPVSVAANLRIEAKVPKKKDAVEIDASKVTMLPSSNKKNFFNNDSDDEDDDDDEEEDPNAGIFDDQDEALEEFNKQREAEEAASQPQDVCTALAGWGDWTGPDIKMSEKIIQKFTDKAPKKPKSKFSDKKNVIYNEKADMHENIRNRMVSELPFPFLRVSDYEASIRGPTGRTFVPELVHQKLIAPPLVTKLGTVIKPMDKTQLLNDKAIKAVVKEKIKKQKRNAQDAVDSGQQQERKKVYIGKQVLELGSSKKRKFSRKSVQ